MTSIYNKNINMVITSDWVIEEIEHVMSIIVNLGYTDIHIMSNFSFNGRFKSLCGRTHRVNGVYTIELNSTFVAIASLSHIKDTIAHECIHLVPGCFDHKTKFKEIGQKLEKYGYDINRTICDKDYMALRKKERNNKIQYVPHCRDCGKYMKSYIKFTDKLKIITNGNNKGGRYFYCPVCRSRNIEVIKRSPEGSEYKLGGYKM